MPPTEQQRDAALFLVRVSLFLGVALFGGVSWFLHHQGAPLPPAVPGLVYVPMVAVPAGFLGIVLVRMVRSQRTDPRQRASLALIGWALGEAPALAGGVYYYMSGDPRWLFIGTFVLLASFLLLPIRAD